MAEGLWFGRLVDSHGGNGRGAEGLHLRCLGNGLHCVKNYECEYMHVELKIAAEFRVLLKGSGCKVCYYG